MVGGCWGGRKMIILELFRRFLACSLPLVLMVGCGSHVETESIGHIRFQVVAGGEAREKAVAAAVARAALTALRGFIK